MTALRGMNNPEPCHFCGAPDTKWRMVPRQDDEYGPDGPALCADCYRTRYPVSERARRELRRILDEAARRMLDENTEQGAVTLKVKRR